MASRAAKKRAFVAKKDRPEVKIDLEKAVTALKVRDLTAIVSQVVYKHFKEFKDHQKEHVKIEKLEKNEHKELKYEKFEKPEKFEREPDPKPPVLEPGPDPKGGGREPGPDFGGFDPVVIDRLVREVANLRQAVADLQERLG